MSLATEYASLLAQISALEQDKATLKNQGLPKDSAKVASQILKLQQQAENLRYKIDANERLVGQKGAQAESRMRVASELSRDEAMDKAILSAEEWDRRQKQRQAEFVRQQSESLANKKLKADIDLAAAEKRADIDIRRIETKGLADAMVEEAKQQTSIRRLGEIRKVASDNRLLTMGPDSEPIKNLVKELTGTPELTALGGGAVATEILAKSASAHASAVDAIRRVQTKMFVDRGYAPPEDLGVKASESLKTGANPYQHADLKLGELQKTEISNREAEAKAAATSARRATLRGEGFGPKMADLILEQETTKGLKPGTTEHADYVKGLKRGAMLKNVGIGAGATVLAGLLAKKIFSSDEQKSNLPPEMQMALAAQIQQAQGGGEDGGKATSRTLTDIGKLLSIIKVMQGMGGGEAQMPISAGSIV